MELSQLRLAPVGGCGCRRQKSAGAAASGSLQVPPPVESAGAAASGQEETASGQKDFEETANGQEETSLRGEGGSAVVAAPMDDTDLNTWSSPQLVRHLVLGF